MKVFLDDTALSVPNATLPAAIDAVRAAAGARGRLVIEVLCDGAPASADVLQSRPAGQADVRELRCRSANLVELIAGMLDDTCAALDQLATEQRAACEKFWIGATAEALESLKPILDRWRLVRETLERCAEALDLSLSSIPATENQNAAALAANLSSNLDSLRSHLSAGKFVELADVVGTDLCTLAAQWRAMLSGLRDALPHGPSGAEAGA